ncbi:uncharacterized mitochondrial protein-like protein [Tanacetum coccineum]|uniref:Uncharacterized mitochondrial protein-like protein n=1 Tax=Tanacetum coccineum TaxID=301880 RepID=A0ABQ5HD83_9ASTR
MEKMRKKERKESLKIIVSEKALPKELYEGSIIGCRVLYKVEDISTCLVKYVKFWDDWEVDHYRNANLGGCERGAVDSIRLALYDMSQQPRWFTDFLVKVRRKFVRLSVHVRYLSEDPDFPDRVYKVEKALYGLHQAPRAWYKTLSTYLLDNEFQRGKIDKTLFIKRYKDEFYGRTYILLGLQVQQKKDGIFISQDKYVAKILKNFVFIEVKTASTPMETQKPLLKDEDGEEVDVHMYRSMIGSLMYLTSSRPDIMFVVCACARYQVNPKVSNLHVVKRFFRYLKGQPKLGLWYPKDSPFDLVAYIDSDYAGASLDRKSTTGGCQFLGCRLISWQCKKQTVVANSTTEAEYVAASSCCGQVLWIQNQLLDYGGPTEHVADEAVYNELDDSFMRAATTAYSLEAKQDSGNIDNTQSKATPNEAGSQRTTSGGCPRHQETIGDTTAQTRFESVSKLSNYPLLIRGNTLQSGEDNLKLNEMMELCTNLQTRVLNLEKTKITQANKIDNLKRRIKRLEKKKRSRTHGLKRLYKVGLSARVESSRDEEDLDDADMFDVNTLTGDEVLAESEVAVKDVNLSVDEVTLAQALVALKSVKPKVNANVVEEPSVPVSAASTKVSAATTTTTTTIPTPRKGIVFQESAEFDEEVRLARKKAEKEQEANVALIEEWVDIQAKIEDDHELAQRLQAQEQEELYDAEKATLFM